MSSGIRKIICSGLQNIKKWTSNPRILVLFLLLFCLLLDLLVPFYRVAGQLEVKNTIWFLPFLTGSRFIGFYFLLGYVLLFCDAPFIDRHQPYVIIRIGKRKWAWGQCLYVMVASAVYVLALQLFVIVILFPSLEFSLDWGNIFYTVSQVGIPGFYPGIDISYGIILEYSPLAATFLAAVLLWMEGVFLGMLMFYMNLRFGRIAGTTLGCFMAMMFLLIKSLINNIPVLWKITPTIWMELSELTSHSLGTHPGLAYGVTALLLLIIVLVALSIWTVKRQPIEVLEQI